MVIESIEETFLLFFDNEVVNKTVEYKNQRINMTIAHLQRTKDYNESHKLLGEH